VTSGTIPSSPASADGFLTVTDGTGSFQLKVDKDTNVRHGHAERSFTIIGSSSRTISFVPSTPAMTSLRAAASTSAAPPRRPGPDQHRAARIDVDGSGNTPGD